MVGAVVTARSSREELGPQGTVPNPPASVGRSTEQSVPDAHRPRTADRRRTASLPANSSATLGVSLAITWLISLCRVSDVHSGRANRAIGTAVAARQAGFVALAIRRSLVNRIAAAWVAVAVVGVAACGSSPSPLAPSLVPASLLLAPADAADEPHAMNAGKSPTASPIVIDRGDLDLSGTGGEMSLSGTRGFSLTAGVTRSGGVATAFDTCFASNCAPGALIPLAAGWSGSDLPGTATLDGITYSDLGSVATAAAGTVQFTGSLVAPPLNRASQTATATFTLRGQFVHADPGGLLVTETFTGEGVARVWLASRQGDSGWSVERVVYKLKHQS